MPGFDYVFNHVVYIQDSGIIDVQYSIQEFTIHCCYFVGPSSGDETGPSPAPGGAGHGERDVFGAKPFSRSDSIGKMGNTISISDIIDKYKYRQSVIFKL